MTHAINPFQEGDPNRKEIWDKLVRKDIDAFLAQDWDMIADDFLSEGFYGIKCNMRANPDAWRLAYPDLNSYRDEWLRQAAQTATEEFAEDLRNALFRVTILRDIDIRGDFAVAHKKFNGSVKRLNGSEAVWQWQSIDYYRRVDGSWKMTSFTGYLPSSGIS